MRTRFIIILTLCLALCLAAVSCNADSTLRDDEVLVSVSFDNGGSRSLSASLESFDTENYYWYYKATKADGGRFKSGQTEGFVALQGDRGLCNDTGRVKISGFSQGLWTFELEAYAGEGKQDLVYKGKTENVMLKNASANGEGCNTVSVVVSPVSDEGNGTLTVAVGAIRAASNYPEADYGVIEGIDLSYAAFGTESWTDVPVAGDTVSLGLAPGAYVVKLTFHFAGDGQTSSSVVATVYSNLVTTVGGNMTSAVSGI